MPDVHALSVVLHVVSSTEIMTALRLCSLIRLGMVDVASLSLARQNSPIAIFPVDMHGIASDATYM